MSTSSPALFPTPTPAYFLSFQFSSWYPIFAAHTPRSIIIRPLQRDFLEYLHSDGSVVVPDGSEDVPAESTLSGDEGIDEDEDGDEEQPRRFAFPELDEKIRAAIKEYDAVFPKLNFSAPKDASWLLPPSSPLKCTSPADVYLLLKSSDFIAHDLSTAAVFEGCAEAAQDGYELELVLRKWYAVDRARELRCFVRHGILIGISQRDTNFYEFYNEPTTRAKVIDTARRFWTTAIRPAWKTSADYIFDIILTRDLARAHVLDFNPYAQRTDSLLFTYSELSALSSSTAPEPELRTIPSRTHPVAARNAPAHQHNMVPLEALALSSGRGAEEFAQVWAGEVRKAARGEEEDDEDGK